MMSVHIKVDINNIHNNNNNVNNNDNINDNKNCTIMIIIILETYKLQIASFITTFKKIIC